MRPGRGRRSTSLRFVTLRASRSVITTRKPTPSGHAPDREALAKMSGGTGAGDLPTWVAVPGGQGVQVGDHGTQDNKYIKHIQTYIATQVIQRSPGPVAEQVVAGEVPQPPPAFQPRADLLAALRAGGSGVSVVCAVTGMRGVGRRRSRR